MCVSHSLNVRPDVLRHRQSSDQMYRKDLVVCVSFECCRLFRLQGIDNVRIGAVTAGMGRNLCPVEETSSVKAWQRFFLERSSLRHCNSRGALDHGRNVRMNQPDRSL